jgi:hypothetical protein
VVGLGMAGCGAGGGCACFSPSIKNKKKTTRDPHRELRLFMDEVLALK